LSPKLGLLPKEKAPLGQIIFKINELYSNSNYGEEVFEVGGPSSVIADRILKTILWN